MRKVRLFSLLFFLLFSFLIRAEEGKIVKKLKVLGTKRVSPLIVLSQVRTKVGEKFFRQTIKEDIKRIYALGYFTDVSVHVEDYQDGLKVVFLVKEKPYITSIQIRGNKVFTKEDIEKVMVLTEGDIFVEKTLKEDVKRIISLYEKKGYYQVKVSYRYEEEDGKIKVYLDIEEGPRIKVKRITILGNKNIPTSQILKVMKTKPAGLLRRGTFGKEVLEEDIQRIEELYKSRGFIDAKVVEKKMEYDPTGTLLYLTLRIKEGSKYMVKKVEVVGNKLYSTSELKGILSMREGSPYNPLILEAESKKLEDFYSHRGYLTTRVWYFKEVDRKKKEAKIRYEIEEGPKFYVRLIHIRGNTRTKDKVIRREILIHPGESFDGEKVKRSQEKIYNLGYFEDVKVKTQPTSQPDQIDLIFEVEEKKTGLLTFGLGYSSIEEFIGYIDLTQSNFDISNPPTFIGGGQKIRVRAQLGSKREDYSISFTEPYFRDKPISLGFDLYNTTRYWTNYDETRRGGVVRGGKKLTESLTLSSRYKYEMVRIYHLSGEVSEELEKEEGKFDTSSISVGIGWDSRDNVFDTSKGVLASTSIEYAGGVLGGDRDFVKWRGDYTRYFPLPKDWVFSFHFGGGVVEEFPPSTRVPIYERFFLGGADTIRGYEYKEVSPEDAEGNPIGGKIYFLSNLEWKYPIVEVIKGVIFVDAGNVWREAGEIGEGELKTGVGVGIRITTPLGPVALDYGYGIQRKKGRLHFTLGYLF